VFITGFYCAIPEKHINVYSQVHCRREINVFLPIFTGCFTFIFLNSIFHVRVRVTGFCGVLPVPNRGHSDTSYSIDTVVHMVSQVPHMYKPLN
jgi:hypothetical protein